MTGPQPRSGVEPAGIDVLEAMATTRAIRRYRYDEPVPEADLARIFFAASRAPSGSNRQLFRFIVLRDGPRAVRAKALLGASFRAGWGEKSATDGYDTASGAAPASRKARTARALEEYVANFERIPVVILACLIRHRRPVPTEGASVYPACQNLLVAARALGYGGVMTMWHGFVEEELRALLEIPDGVALAATITLGRPAGGHGPVRRQPLPEFVYDDGWGREAGWAVEPPGTPHAAGAHPDGSPRRTGTGQDRPPTRATASRGDTASAS